MSRIQNFISISCFFLAIQFFQMQEQSLGKCIQIVKFLNIFIWFQPILLEIFIIILPKYLSLIFLSQDMFSKLLTISFFLVLLQADTFIYQRCVPCTVKPGCNECLVYQGGPFNNQNNTNISVCVDNLLGCKYRNYKNTVFQFSCESCRVDGWCSYTVDGYFLGNISFYTGCSNSSDPVWTYTKNYLDKLYISLYGNRIHSWCENVCDKITAGQQGLVIIAVVSLLTILFATVSHFALQKIR